MLSVRSQFGSRQQHRPVLVVRLWNVLRRNASVKTKRWPGFGNLNIRTSRDAHLLGEQTVDLAAFWKVADEV